MDPDADDSEGLRQPEMQVEGNKDAARALLRVKQKLDGYEEGEMRSLQGQVQESNSSSINSPLLLINISTSLVSTSLDELRIFKNLQVCVLPDFVICR